MKKKRIVLTQGERIASLEKQVETLRGQIQYEGVYAQGLGKIARQIDERVCGVEMRLARLENSKPWWRIW